MNLITTQGTLFSEKIISILFTTMMHPAFFLQFAFGSCLTNHPSWGRCCCVYFCCVAKDKLEEVDASLDYFLYKSFPRGHLKKMISEIFLGASVWGNENVRYLHPFAVTGKNRRFNQSILDWTNQCKSCPPLVAKSASLQTAPAANTSGPIYKTFFAVAV